MMAVVRLETGDHQPENGFVSSETTSTGLLSRIDGSVLPFLGGFGKYQKQLVVLTWIPALFIGFSQFSDYFLLAQPNNTCVHPTAETRNLTENFTSSLNYTNGSTAAPYSISNVTHSDSKSINCSCMAWNYELQMGLVQNVVTKWNLVCGSERKVHIAKFSLLVGSIFGYLVLGVLADWFGRRPVLITSVLFVLVFGLAVAFSVNVPMFSTLRFFEGFCLAGITLSLYVLRIELCLPLWRFRVTMVANFVVLAGQLLMPGLAALCRDWQVLQAVIICPLVLMLSYIWIFPESLRWLLSTQQYCRAKRQMFRIAKKNKVGETDADEVFAEIQRETQSKPKKTCIVKMVGTRTLWKNIVVLCVNSLTGYGIHHCFARSMIDPEAGATTMFQSFYTDYFMMAGIAVASCMALCPVVEFMGRRGGLLAFMIITALASLLQLGLLNLLGKYSMQLNIEQSETLNKKFSIAFSIIGMFSSHAVSNLSIFFCAEITPTVIRGGGLGLVLASAGFGMLTAPIMELHDQKGYFLHHIIFACCTLICIICILLLPETRYQPLPETIGDGEAYTRQPLLPPKKPGEQDPLLTKLDPAGGQETALGGADNPPSAGDVNAAPPCGVEDEVPCIVIPPPCTMDDAAAEPIALDTIIPTAADSISLCATPPATDTTDSKTTDTESPTAAEASPPGITDSALPIAADAIPPCVTDTPPTTATDPTPLSKDAELPRTTDTASPPATDTTNSKTTDTALPTTTDTTNDKTIDIELPTATDTTNSKTNDVELPAATDTTNSKTTDVELPTTTDTTNGKITDTALPTATDTTNGKTTDTALPTATDTTNSKITDTALPTATDTPNGKTTDTLSTTATDVKPPCITDAAPHAATDTTDPRIPDTSPSADKDDAPVHATDAAQPTTVDSISGSNDGTPPAGATDATPPAAPPLCTTDAVAPPPPDTEPTANSKAPCSMDVSPTGPAPSPSSVPANDAPPSPTDSVSPTTTDPDRAIPVNGTASGVRSS